MDKDVLRKAREETIKGMGTGPEETKAMLSGAIYGEAVSATLTSTGQAALALALLVMKERGCVAIGLESFTYPHAIGLCKTLGLEVIELQERDIGGQIQNALAQGCRLFYLMPEMHNPVGRSQDPLRFQEVCDALRGREGLILEDAAYSFLRAGADSFTKVFPDRTLRIESLTKALLQDAPMGALQYPEYLKPRVSALERQFGLGATADSIRIISAVAREGMLEKLIEAKRQEGRLRSRMAEEVAGIRIKNGWYGLLHTDTEDMKLVAELEMAGVLVAPGRQFRARNDATNIIRVSLGGELDRERLRMGLIELGRVLDGRLIPAHG